MNSNIKKTPDQTRRGTLRHDGIDIPYTVEGDGEPVVLIHGGIGQIEVWEPVSAELARTHRVIAYDQRGHGRSQAPGTPDMRKHIADAAAIIEQVVGGPATVVCWSGGGSVGLGLTVARPELVDRLIVMEAVFRVMSASSWEDIKNLVRFKRIVRRRPSDAVDDFMRPTFGYRSGGTAWDELPEEVRQLFRADANGFRSTLRIHPFSISMDWLWLRDSAVAKCPVPVTWVGGEESAESFHKIHSKLAAADPELHTVMVPGATHALPVLQPSALVEVVRETAGAPAR